MKKSQTLFFIIILVQLILLGACNSGKKNLMQQNYAGVGIASPPAIVYKTKKDYDDKVPVTLSADKGKITAYPAPSDLLRGGQFTYPTKLNQAYLLDNRGISVNTAFLSFTYADYYNMDMVLNADRLMNYILDDDPFEEYYELGRRNDFANFGQEINAIIDQGKLAQYKNQIQ